MGSTASVFKINFFGNVLNASEQLALPGSKEGKEDSK